MQSNKPYLIRAYYEWIMDNTCTPYIVINATIPRCNVPQEHVEEGEIIFNISPQAIRDLKIGNDILEFRASFSGVVRIVSAPIRAVLAIYAEENGQGMFFELDEEDSASTTTEWSGSPAQPQTEELKTDKKQPSHLRLVE